MKNVDLKWVKFDLDEMTFYGIVFPKWVKFAGNLEFDTNADIYVLVLLKVASNLAQFAIGGISGNLDVFPSGILYG